jgi:hypothetical protein
VVSVAKCCGEFFEDGWYGKIRVALLMFLLISEILIGVEGLLKLLMLRSCDDVPSLSEASSSYTA